MLHSFNVSLIQTAGNGNELVRDFTQWCLLNGQLFNKIKSWFVMVGHMG